MMRAGALVLSALALVGCGGDSELREIAADTCAVLADPGTPSGESSLLLFEFTRAALDLGYTESEFADALRAECPDGVIIGGEG